MQMYSNMHEELKLFKLRQVPQAEADMPQVGPR